MHDRVGTGGMVYIRYERKCVLCFVLFCFFLFIYSSHLPSHYFYVITKPRRHHNSSERVPLNIHYLHIYFHFHLSLVLI